MCRSSVAYGTPPRLRSTHHDVRKAELSTLFVPKGGVYPRYAAIFIAFITLAEVLDKYLEDAFDLQARMNVNHAVSQLDMESELSRWEMTLPDDLRRSLLRGSSLHTPGLPNLRLSYLYVKLMARKHVVDRAKANPATDVATLRTAHLHVRRAAEDIVLFVHELTKAALADFWFPLNAFALSATVASLLRGALELEQSRENSLAQSISIRLAQDLLKALQGHRQTSEWELGDICVAQYSDIVEKLPTDPSAANSGGELGSADNGLQFDMFNGMDVSWPSPDLWELFTNR